MVNPHAPSLPAPDERLALQRSVSGVWLLDGDQLSSIDEADDGPAVVLVRSEHVLLLTAPLPPLVSVIRRRNALPFAIEEYIAEPLEGVHIALGAETAPGIWLAGVVDHEMMAVWLDRLGEAGLERARLVPDVLALPVPGAGSWSVDLVGQRAMVRADDGSGFAVPLAQLDAAWRAAGEPACIAYGEPLPPQFAAPQAVIEDEPLAMRLLVPDLEIGRAHV